MADTGKYWACNTTSQMNVYGNISDTTSSNIKSTNILLARPNVKALLKDGVFVYPSLTKKINNTTCYKIVKPSLYNLSNDGNWYIYPGKFSGPSDRWKQYSKYANAVAIVSKSIVVKVYEKTNTDSSTLFTIDMESFKRATGRSALTVGKSSTSGWYVLYWPSLFGGDKVGYINNTDANLGKTDAAGNEIPEGTTTDGTAGGSSTTEASSHVEDLILTPEQIEELDIILENSINESLNDEDIFGVNYLIGSPFQFLEATDYRSTDVNTNVTDIDERGNRRLVSTSNYKIGRSYTENIVTEAPIIYIMPGEPSFMAGFDKNEKEVVQNYISSRAGNADDVKSFDELMAQYQSDGKDFGRYYDFKGNYAEYMRHVNLLCRAASIYIGLGDEFVPSQPYNDGNEESNRYKNYDWKNWGRTKSYSIVNDKHAGSTEEDKPKFGSVFEDVSEWVKETAGDTIDSATRAFGEFKDAIFGDDGFLKVYFDPSTSANEDMGNDTRSSSIASLFDQASDLYKEAAYLVQDTGVLKDLTAGVASLGTSVLATSGSLLDKVGFGNFGQLMGLSSQVLQGANIVFPDMWGDSSYSRSYNITVNLASPYGDKESVFLNVIVPMLHLVALGLPRQASANAITAPFILRAFAPGIFSCDLGIVTSMSITKCPNGNDAYNVMGLPTEVQVQLSIRDLYSNLSMTSVQHPILFYNNQGLTDFLGVICGLNFARPTLNVRLMALWSILKNSVLQLPSEIMSDVRQRTSNWLRDWMGI